MGNARKRADAELMAIYAEIPDMLDCKGLCHDSCGPIPLTKREWQRLDMRGVQIPDAMKAVEEIVATNGQWSCPALVNNRCSVYEVRPLICRMYGTVDTEHLRCVHGCSPVGRFLTDVEARSLIERTLEAGGGQQGE